MSQKKHTPGPWAYVETDHGAIVVEDVNGWICEMSKWEGQDNLANAHLIAASPDMLEALEAIDVLLDMGDDVPWNTAFTFDNLEAINAINAAFAKARAAIKKARGEK